MSPEEKKERKRLYDIEYRKKNKEKIALQKKEWVEKNPDKIKSSREKHKEAKKVCDKRYAQINKDKVNTIKKNWAKENKEKVKQAKLKHFKNKLANDPLYKLKHNIGCSIRQSFKRNGFTKKSRTYMILGCTFEEFKQHLESLWEPWMSWGNYGLYNGTSNYGWDIDHIIPSSSAVTEEDVIKLNHYTNLKPLCSFYNRNIKKHYTNVGLPSII
jgi:superfamily II DNA/RNA helicase